MNCKSDGNGKEINVDQIVLIKEKNLLCTQWVLGRVLEIHYGQDNNSAYSHYQNVCGNIEAIDEVFTSTSN